MVKQTLEETAPTLNINGQRRKLRYIDIINIPTHDKWRVKRTRVGYTKNTENGSLEIIMHYSIDQQLHLCIQSLLILF